jgi:hypothetical protein
MAASRHFQMRLKLRICDLRPILNAKLGHMLCGCPAVGLIAPKSYLAVSIGYARLVREKVLMIANRDDVEVFAPSAEADIHHSEISGLSEG